MKNFRLRSKHSYTFSESKQISKPNLYHHVQAHAESLHLLAQSHHEAAETLQDTTSKIATHQLETALLTADTARQIREVSYFLWIFTPQPIRSSLVHLKPVFCSAFYQMTELARFQISDAVGTTAAPVTTLFDQEQKHSSAFIKQLKLHNMNRYFIQKFNLRL